MAKRILWLDNDSAYISVYAKHLRNQPDAYEVLIAPTLTDADTLLNDGRFDLLILDVMVPTTSEEEERAYPPESTDHGLKMGLAFYHSHRQVLEHAKTKVLVLTARIDEAIKQGFEAEGLSENQIVEKPEVGDVDDFLHIVEQVLGKQ